MIKGQKRGSSDSVKAEGGSVRGDSVRKEYLEHRKTLVEGEQKAYESYDRYLLTLSAGALGVSVNLVRVFNLQDGPRLCLLGGASFICLSLVLVLVSFLFSQRAWNRERNLLDNLYERRNEASPSETNPYSNLTFYFNVTATIAFVVGTIMVILAIASNSHDSEEGGRQLSPKTATTSSGEGRGSIPPSAPKPPTQGDRITPTPPPKISK